jgi:hypothetical protein
VRAILARAQRLAGAGQVTVFASGHVENEPLPVCVAELETLVPTAALTWRWLLTWTEKDRVDIRNQVIAAVLAGGILLSAEALARGGSTHEPHQPPNRVELRDMTPAPPAPPLGPHQQSPLASPGDSDQGEDREAQPDPFRGQRKT